jgi:hypothetical protein
MTEADRAFYEWYHENAQQKSVTVETLRESFMAGWFACQTGEGRPDA